LYQQALASQSSQLAQSPWAGQQAPVRLSSTPASLLRDRAEAQSLMMIASSSSSSLVVVRWVHALWAGRRCATELGPLRVVFLPAIPVPVPAAADQHGRVREPRRTATAQGRTAAVALSHHGTAKCMIGRVFCGARPDARANVRYE
jgi:hypothetical protein